MLTQITLSAKGLRWWRTGHPWIYRDDLGHGQSADPGEIVAVADGQGHFLGQAFYSATSRIALRMLTTAADPIDQAFWECRLRQAFRYRRLVVQDSSAFRLIYAEADGFPGLIIDSYAGHLVLQLHHPGMVRMQGMLVDILRRLVTPKSLTLRNDSDVRRLEGLPVEVEILSGEVPDRVVIQEGPLQFLVDIRHGQKTGMFLDQRENHQAAAAWAHGEVLDCFSYQGGFALPAARLARQVVAVESSAPSLLLARENARLNRIENVEWIQANCFDFLKAAVAGGRQFDLVVLDPPAFAKSRADQRAAFKGYRDLNRRALLLLKPGGVLITCSCSYNLPPDAFLEVLRQAGRESRRQARLIECRGASKDHPVLLSLPESSYLKCNVIMVL
jgi:23S rRNA (cytosine1962-C5)-methyltransferase